MSKIALEKVLVVLMIMFAYIYLYTHGGISSRESLSMLLGGLMMFAVQGAFDEEDEDFETTMEEKSDETH